MPCPYANTTSAARARYQDYLAVHRQVALHHQIEEEPLTFREWRRREREAIETIIPSEEYAEVFAETVMSEEEIYQLMQEYARGNI